MKVAKHFMKASDLPRRRLIPTGIPGLDYALGGGIGWGKISIVVGNPSSGKTSLALNVCRIMQHAHDADIVWVDAECSFDPEWVASWGIDLDKVLVITSQRTSDSLPTPMNQEMAYSAVCDILSERYNRGATAPCVIVVDSIAGLSPSAEMEGEIGEFKIGLRARLTSQFLRTVLPLLAATGSTLILIQHYTYSVGPVPVRTMPGGEAQKYLAITIITLRQDKVIEVHDVREERGEKVVYIYSAGMSVAWSIDKCKQGGTEKSVGKIEMIHHDYGGYKAPCFLAAPDLVMLGYARGAVKRVSARTFVLPDGTRGMMKKLGSKLASSEEQLRELIKVLFKAPLDAGAVTLDELMIAYRTPMLGDKGESSLGNSEDSSKDSSNSDEASGNPSDKDSDAHDEDSNVHDNALGDNASNVSCRDTLDNGSIADTSESPMGSRDTSKPGVEQGGEG